MDLPDYFADAESDFDTADFILFMTLVLNDVQTQRADVKVIFNSWTA